MSWEMIVFDHERVVPGVPRWRADRDHVRARPAEDPLPGERQRDQGKDVPDILPFSPSCCRTRVSYPEVAAPAYSRDGFYPGICGGIENLKLEGFAGSAWQMAYARTAPNPGHWPTLIGKVQQLDRAFEGWPPEDIQSIKAPTLVMIGDSDVVRPEHVVELFRLLGGGVAGDLAGLPSSQLAVLPGTTHVTLVDRVDWLLSMIAAFLDAPMPKAR